MLSGVNVVLAEVGEAFKTLLDDVPPAVGDDELPEFASSLESNN